jgi:hypothetical protein
MHYRPRIKTALSPFALLLVILISHSLFAQVTSGTISGFVKDPSGAYVKGASVTAENPTNGLTRTVTTSEGRVRISGSLSWNLHDQGGSAGLLENGEVRVRSECRG